MLEHKNNINIAYVKNKEISERLPYFSFHIKFLAVFIISIFLFILNSNVGFGQIGGRGGGNNPFGGAGFGNNNTRPGTNDAKNIDENKESLASKRKNRPKRDTLSTSIPDSLRSLENKLETTVESFSSDSTILDVETQRYHLYGDAQVIYGEIELKADYIMLNWDKSEVFAHGTLDTTSSKGNRKVKGKPIFVDGEEEYNSDTIRYNFKSKRAMVSNIVTQQGEGFVQGKKVKKDEDDNMYLLNAKYTTCNLTEPHFHIRSKRIKLVNKKSMISGPFNLMLSDIPLPIGLPFGFFPIPKKKEIGTSGFVMGNYGEEPNNRGFYFRDFGYYHAFNEYVGAKFLAQIYSTGSYGFGLQSNYIKKYRYSGNLNLQYNFNKNGEVIPDPKRTPAKDFNITWSHSPQNLRPDRSFSANVNIVSNGFNRNNGRLDQLNQYTNNTFGSSVQYGRNFGKLLRTSTGFRVDQNVSTKVMNSSLDYTLALNQFNPFVKEKNQLGNWFDAFRVGIDLSGGYRVSNDITSRQRSSSYTDYKIVGVENRPLTNEELRLQSLGISRNTSVIPLNSADNIKYIINELGQFRSTFTVPITLPNFKLARYINLTPSVGYRGDIFTQRLNYTYKPELDAVKIDTAKGFFAAGSWNTSASLNTRIYGTYQFKKSKRLQALRHTIAPSLGIGYSPDLSKNQNLYTKTRVRKDDVNERFLSRFTELQNGVGASGSINFGVTNQLEAKVRSKSDTASVAFEKISILDNLSLNTSYNFFALKQSYKYLIDTVRAGFNLSDISLSTNTSFFKDLINVNVNAGFDPYTYVKDAGNESNKAGRRVPVFKWKHNGFAGNYLSNMNLSIGTSFSPDKLKKNGKPVPKPIVADEAKEAMEQFVKANPLAYVDFSIPWSVTISYNLSYYKQGLAPPQLTQAAQFNGDLSLTKKLKINFSSGWDFVYKGVTLTNIGIMRELHCWDMSFNWTPIAGNNLRASNYSFTLQPRSSLLRDLKLSRRRVYYDRGGF